MEFAREKHVFCYQSYQQSGFTHVYRRDNVQNVVYERYMRIVYGKEILYFGVCILLAGLGSFDFS